MDGFVLLAPLIVIAVLIGTLVFQLLWNTTMPEVFGLKTVRYWQAFRILLLASLLFGPGFLVRFHS